MNILKQGFNFIKGATSKVVDFAVEQKDKALGLLGLGVLSTGGATAAKADLAADMTAITTSATDGLSTIGASQSTVIQAVFAIVLLFVGAGILFKTIKKG